MGLKDFFENVTYDISCKIDEIKDTAENIKDTFDYEFENKKYEFNERKEMFLSQTSDAREKISNTLHTVGNFTDANLGYGISGIFESKREAKKGDHIKVKRIKYNLERNLYTHHGIYCGDGQVIHYLREGVRITSLEEFADGEKVHILSEIQSPRRYDADEIISRAKSRLFECEYNLINNNCENFARWCRNGKEFWE